MQNLACTRLLLGVQFSSRKHKGDRYFDTSFTRKKIDSDTYVINTNELYFSQLFDYFLRTLT